VPGCLGMFVWYRLAIVSAEVLSQSKNLAGEV
jgi:hypothetical protein